MTAKPPIEDRIAGALLGVAVADSIGLPAEGLSRQRIARGNWNPWQHRMLFGRGMVSDDTEHTVLVAEAILASKGDPKKFEDRLSSGLRRWFLAAPPGVGWATLRSCLKLCLGVSPAKSGVFSAGNGPAMRSGIIGAVFPEDERIRKRLVRISTRMTHTDPIAEIGARIVTEFVAAGVRGESFDLERLFETASDTVESEKAKAIWLSAVENFRRAIDRDLPVDAFADALGYENGVPGYIVPSVMVAVYAWQRHGDFKSGLTAVLNCGGDTDTNGAIFGAIASGSVGVQSIPKEWIDGIRDWPCSVERLKMLARALEQMVKNKETSVEAVRILKPFPFILIRNLIFFVILVGQVALRLANRFTPVRLSKYPETLVIHDK